MKQTSEPVYREKRGGGGRVRCVGAVRGDPTGEKRATAWQPDDRTSSLKRWSKRKGKDQDKRRRKICQQKKTKKATEIEKLKKQPKLKLRHVTIRG